MADLSNYIKTIEEASRGEEVRDAIINAIKALGEADEFVSKSNTYTLTLEGTSLKLTDGNGNSQNVVLPADNNTTYTLSIDGDKLMLTPSDGDAQTVTLPSGGSEADTNTTYTLSLDDHTLTLKDSDGTEQTVTLPNDAEAALSEEY